MPQLVADVEQVAAVITRKNPTFGVQVGNVGDIGTQPHLGAGIVRIDLERPEQPAERQLLLVGHRLLRKDEDGVAREGRLDLGKYLGRHQAGQINPPYLGTERWMKRALFDCHVAPPIGRRYYEPRGSNDQFAPDALAARGVAERWAIRRSTRLASRCTIPPRRGTDIRFFRPPISAPCSSI